MGFLFFLKRGEEAPLKIRSAKQLTLQATHMKDSLCCLRNHRILEINEAGVHLII